MQAGSGIRNPTPRCEALEKENDVPSEVELVTAISRTQTVVAIGNLLDAIPLAALIDLILR